MLLPIIMQTY